MGPEPAASTSARGLDVLVFYVPVKDTDRVLEAVFAAGAGEIGDYRDCAFVTTGTGQFRPLAGASPTIGAAGELEHVTENRVELVLPRHLRAGVVAALRAAHPYEDPAFHVIGTAPIDGVDGPESAEG
ncbi:MAG: hypothetical protein L0H25_08090 [Micrococcales bacterium]|nr:hypothetical protein [Micrococcales bacterium]